MSDQMLSLLGNIKTAKEEIERLRSSLEDSQSESGRLTAELAKWQEQAEVNKHDAHNFHDIVVQKDKRIEELLEAEIEPIVGVFRNGHLVTYKQINAAWADAWGKYRGTDSTAGFSSLEKVGIVACEECGGSGGIPEGGNIRTCPSCDGHGWRIKTSPLVDKCGQFGTGDDDEK